MRNPCNLFSFPPPIVIHWEEICIQTQPTPIQSVESVLELRKHLGFAKRSQWGLVDVIGWYYGIRKASEDKTLRSTLVAEAWRAQVHWVDKVWRVFCYFCTPTYSPVDRFRLEGSQRCFLPSSSISYSITHLCVILCLHLSFLTLVFYIYYLLFMFMH